MHDQFETSNRNSTRSANQRNRQNNQRNRRKDHIAQINPSRARSEPSKRTDQIPDYQPPVNHQRSLNQVNQNRLVDPLSPGRIARRETIRNTFRRVDRGIRIGSTFFVLNCLLITFLAFLKSKLNLLSLIRIVGETIIFLFVNNFIFLPFSNHDKERLVDEFVKKRRQLTGQFATRPVDQFYRMNYYPKRMAVGGD